MRMATVEDVDEVSDAETWSSSRSLATTPQQPAHSRVPRECPVATSRNCDDCDPPRGPSITAMREPESPAAALPGSPARLSPTGCPGDPPDE